jgi:hypothetical protein
MKRKRDLGFEALQARVLLVLLQLVKLSKKKMETNHGTLGTISPAELKKLRRCGSFDLSGPIVYQRL